MAAESMSARRLHDLEAEIPVREGEYGDRVMTVEPGGIGYVVARAGELDAGHSHENFLLLIGYWITRFLGVILADYWLHRGRYDERDFINRRHNPIAGLAAVAAGIVVSTPFWNQSLWHGPVVDALPQLGALSFIVGCVVAAGVYFALAGKSVTEAAAADRSLERRRRSRRFSTSAS